MRRAVLFDLDDTLYDAGQYYRGAFHNIAQNLSKKYGVPEHKTETALVHIWRLKSSMYGYIFTDVIRELNISVSLASIIRMFDNYDGKIVPYPGTRRLFLSLRQAGFKIGIITDGKGRRQRKKVQRLGLDHLTDAVIVTDIYGNNKLSAAPFIYALHKLNCEAGESFFIGNNPVLDFKGARVAGLQTIRLIGGEFSSIPSNSYINNEIYKITELKTLLGRHHRTYEHKET